MSLDLIRRELKLDLNIAEEIWVNILNKTFPDNIKYIYAKGSAIKKWESDVDYVPLLSDLDIHFKTKNGSKLVSNLNNPFLDSTNCFVEYQIEFEKRRSNYKHIPRMQVMNLSELSEKIQIMPPNINSIKVLYGNYTNNTIPSNEELRKVDASNLSFIPEFLDSAPESIFDKSGMDLWVFLRNLSWKISPTPVRLLTQINECPFDCWGWNRSKIIKNLSSNGFDDIAKHYQEYYLTGWQLFNDNFKDIFLYKKIMEEAYYVLRLTYNAFQNL